MRTGIRLSSSARSALDYQRITRSFFAISMERDGLIHYSRCNFSSGAADSIHCFDLVYPQQEKRAWDAVVTRISHSLRPLEVEAVAARGTERELSRREPLKPEQLETRAARRGAAKHKAEETS